MFSRLSAASQGAGYTELDLPVFNRAARVVEAFFRFASAALPT